MNYFNSKYLKNIDQKGRLLLPRDIMDLHEIDKGSPLYLIPNPGNPPFLEMRTERQWDLYIRRIMRQTSDSVKRDLLRYVRISQEIATVDGQGRVLLSQRLRDLCKLDGNVAVINMTTLIEVWNVELVRAKMPLLTDAYNKINDKFF